MAVGYTSNRIIQAGLSLSDVTVGAVATYSFTANNTNTLPAGAQLHLYFPSPFDVTGLTCTFDTAAATFSIVNSTYLWIEIAAGMAPFALAGHTF